jgi:predicted GIY-YIG superfamily endonuclease
MENKVVAHMKDKTLYKGVTQDFLPEKPSFHILPAEGGGVPKKINVEEMKALFFVKDYIGNRDYVTVREFEHQQKYGKKTVITFKDGEIIWGTTQGYDKSRKGFFFYPIDINDNNIRVYIVASSVKKVEFFQ